MRYGLLIPSMCFFAATVTAAPPIGPCPGRIADYVVRGAEDMLATRPAELLECSSDSEFLPVTESDTGPIIENRLVTQADFERIVRRHDTVEFRFCRFKTQIDLTGQHVAPSVVFRRCDFEGNVAVRFATIAGGLAFDDCLFHQNIDITSSRIGGPVTFTNTVLTSHLEVEGTTLSGGLRSVGSRFAEGVIFRDVRTPAALLFESVRFIGPLSISELESGGGVRFKDCGFDRSSLISVSGGTITAGMRFDSCTFDNDWRQTNDRSPAHLKLSDVSLGSAFVISRTPAAAFPSIRISRSVIPFLKIPEWSVVKTAILPATISSDDVRELEEVAELLQLVHRGYDAEGRTRDAETVRSLHQLLLARLKGPIAYVLRLVVNSVGAASFVLIAFILIAMTIIAKFGTKWGLVPDGLVRWQLPFYAFLFTGRSRFGAVHREELSSASAAGMAVVYVARGVGMAAVFLLGIFVNEILHV